MLRRQKIFLGVVVLTNALLWIIPSNVVELVARDRHTLLGRYSREHFSWILGVFVISVVGLYLDWAPPQKRRKRGFQVIAILVFLVPGVGLADYLARSPEREHYVKDSLAYHRPPNAAFIVPFEDRPQAKRTYPNAPPGAGTLKCIYHTDTWGFRNRNHRQHYDVVVLGDSFAEGSRVSDEHPWPVRLAQRSQLSVYNLGMSGYAPVNYLASLQEYGLKLSPRVVMCMLYEGNDLRSAKSRVSESAPSLAKRIKTYFKQSPLRNGADRLLVETLGPIGCDREVCGLDILSWLPLAIPDGPETRYYAFAPKQLLGAYISQENFRRSKRWQNVAGLLLEMKNLSRSAGVKLIMIYAPTKAHVMLPLVQDRLPADQVHAFASLRSDELPDPDIFMRDLFSCLTAKQSVVREWCRGQDVLFLDVTEALRKHAAEGHQVYYTYDQHWTPMGHDVVAETVQRFLNQHQLHLRSQEAARN